MSVDFKDSETLKNLMRAFAGESQARNRYTFAASLCKSQKLHVLEAVFQFTAGQEKEHAEIFYNHMKEMAGSTIQIDGGYPVDIYESVSELLRAAEQTNMKNLTRCIRRLGIRRWRRAFRRWQHPFIRLQALKKHMETVSDSLRIYWRKINYSSILWNVNGCA